MKTSNLEFSNRDITVTFEPKVCICAERCARELSSVFRTNVIPWVKLDNDTDRIVEQIKKCPSGALQYHYNKKQAS